eukprot:1932489-Prorocentrum_lima.AAC.1
MGVGVATTKHDDDSPCRKLAGLLLALPRPHGQVCGKVNRHGREHSVAGVARPPRPTARAP